MVSDMGKNSGDCGEKDGVRILNYGDSGHPVPRESDAFIDIKCLLT